MISRYALPLLALAMLGFAVVAVVNGRTPRNTLPPPEPPAQSPYGRTVAAVGLVEASSENIAIGTPVAGLVVAVHAKAGDRVQAGAPLGAPSRRSVPRSSGRSSTAGESGRASAPRPHGKRRHSRAMSKWC
jgi:HlyD family secretion protein